MKLQVAAVFLVATATVALPKRSWRSRWCVNADASREGDKFLWTKSGLRDDGLQVTTQEGAFAPTGETYVYKYPMDRMLMQLGLTKAKVVYDYSTDTPVAVVRIERHGTGPCVIVDPDIDTYPALMEALLAMNMSNSEVPPESAEYTLVATQTTDDSSFSQFVKDFCSKDKCGRPVPPIYYTTEPAAADESDDEDDGGLVILMVQDRVVISGLDYESARVYVRQHRRPRVNQNGGSDWRQRRRERRLQRRQERRQERRQGMVFPQ